MQLGLLVSASTCWDVSSIRNDPNFLSFQAQLREDLFQSSLSIPAERVLYLLQVSLVFIFFFFFLVFIF